MTTSNEQLPPHTFNSHLLAITSQDRQHARLYAEDYARAALAQRQQVPVLQQARAALLEMARGCSSCQDGPDGEFCCRKTQWHAIQAIDALTAAPSAQAEPALCHRNPAPNASQPMVPTPSATVTIGAAQAKL